MIPCHNVMRYVLCFFIFLAWGFDAGAVIVSGDVYGGAVAYNDDLRIEENTVFMPDEIHVLGSMRLFNRGIVDTDLFVCDRCDLFIRNQGSFIANVNLGNEANLYQVINNSDDCRSVNLGIGYSLLIDGADGIEWRDVRNAIGMADRVVVKDSVVNIAGVDGTGNKVELVGNVTFIVDELENDVPRLIMKNVYGGDVQITVRTLNSDSLYADVGYLSDGNLFFKRIRETDYTKVLDNDVGVFLNSIRTDRHDDLLINRLDAAKTREELNSVMGRSVRFNHKLLAKPIRIINGLDDNGVDLLSDKQRSSGIDIAAIASKDFYAYMGTIGVKFSTGTPFDFALGIKAGEIDYSSDVDEFSGDFYGIDIRARYEKSNFFVNTGAGVSVFNTDIDRVWYDNRSVMDVDVGYVFAVLDGGWRFRMAEDLLLKTFVGAKGEFLSVADVTDFYTRPRFGVNMEYVSDLFGVRYRYSLGYVASTDNEMMAQAGVGVQSMYDMIGIGAKIALGSMQGTSSVLFEIGGHVIF